MRKQRSLFGLLLGIILVICYASYIAISNIVVEQSRLQQQSVAPVFSLVVEELYKPVHTAQALASAGVLSNLLTEQELDQKAVTNYLKALQNKLDMLVFVASEKHQIQINSDGSSLDLQKQPIQWYPKMKAMNGNIFAVLGNRQNVHLYVDIKIYSDQGEFLGFIGVGKSLESFWNVFQQYKAKNGYDLLFVNKENQVLLSSLIDFQAQFKDVVNLNELDWYKNTEDTLAKMANLSSIVIQIDDEDHVVTQFNLPQLNWRLFLISPMAKRQAEINYAFFINGAQLAGILISILLVIYAAFAYQRRNIESRINIDPLTKLPNRDKISQWFEDQSNGEINLAVIMIDIDHFKNINDTHGHNAGDKVIKMVVSMINENIREQDLAGRWGGEEFILFLPNTSLKVATQRVEHIRQTLETTPIAVNEQLLTVTASFGVTHSLQPETLESIVAQADSALYKAKQQGRNRVCTSH